MSDSYKLVYFPGRGKAELIRYLLVVGQADWSDVRIRLDEWRIMKKYAKYEELPVLQSTDDQWRMTNAYETSSFLAEKFGLKAGPDPLHMKNAKQIVDAVFGLYHKLQPTIRAVITRNDKNRKRVWDEFKFDHLFNFLDVCTIYLMKNKRTWLVGNEMSWADLAVAEFLERCETCFDMLVLKDYFELRMHTEKVHRHPLLQTWCDKRPRSVF